MTVNAHTHLYSGLVPFGMPRPEREPRNFPEILQEVWWRLDRALDERSLRAAARWYVAEAARLGTTALVDHHESPSMIEGSLDILADVCEELGMPALLCYGATERNGGREEARRGLAECRRFILSNRRAQVRGAVGLHAAFTVSDETMREAGALCRELGVPLHVHVAEDAVDRDGLRRLLASDALVPGSILAHGVHLTEDEVRQCDALGLWLVQNPRSNRANGVGYARSLRASERVALGTDGFASDMGAESAVLRESGENEDLIASRMAAGEMLLQSLSSRAAAAPEGRRTARDPLPAAPSTDDGRGSLAALHPLRGFRQLGMTVKVAGLSPSPNLDEIESNAREEAARLWENMKCIR